MRPSVITRGSMHDAPVGQYTLDMHNERTRVDVFTRIPDNRAHRVEMGRMSLVVMRCGSASIRREPSDIRTRPNNVLTFIHQVRGHSSFTHYGCQIDLEEGDFTLCNNSRQYDLMLHGPNDVIFFRVPASIVKTAIPSPDMLCGRRLAHDESLASLAAAMLQHLSTQPPNLLDPEASERAGRHLLDVLANSYTHVPIDQKSGTEVMSSRFWKAKLFIEEHLRDPELNTASIAHHLRLSSRYLRMIFAVSEESPSTYIHRRRLEECAAQLRDARWRQHSITNIAFSWGFNSAPHFARSFRAHFGCSPRDYRHQHLTSETCVPH